MNNRDHYDAQILGNIVYIPPSNCQITLEDFFFFEENKLRRYRLRPLNKYDFKYCNMIGLSSVSPQTGMRWYILLRVVAPGIVMPIFCQTFLSVSFDAPEEMCKYLYKILASPERLELCDAVASDARNRGNSFAFRWGAPHV